MTRLVRRPIWLAGTAGDTLGYVAQAAALGLGSLVLVQPLLATSLLFALPLGAWWAGRRLRRSDGVWALVLTAALGVFLVAGNPTNGVDRAPIGALADRRGDPRTAVVGLHRGGGPHPRIDPGRGARLRRRGSSTAWPRPSPSRR